MSTERQEVRQELIDQLRPAVRSIDLSRPREVHLVGVGGAGMRAIARVLHEMGHHVSGSDMATTAHTERLQQLGIPIADGHERTTFGSDVVVARSTAVPDTNPEVVAARGAAVTVFDRAEILAAIASVRPAILVAGTHGKTTTSSMLAVLLEACGHAPSFIIGADVERFGTGARWSDGPWSVIEADESDGTFLVLDAVAAIVTSLDPDHLDFYGSVQAMQDAFAVFVDRVDGPVALCVDDSDAACLLEANNVVTYGQRADADVVIAGRRSDGLGQRFNVEYAGSRAQVHLAVPGTHNALNAAGAVAIAVALGVPLASAALAVSEFSGVSRRFEPRGSLNGVDFVDDYAHLPAEVEAALSAARSGSWQRIVCAYQPHRFSRTAKIGASFARSFADADITLLTDIYPAGEHPVDGVDGRIVFDAVRSERPNDDVRYTPTLDDVATTLAEILQPGDLCLTLGAGDLTTVPPVVQELITRTTTTKVPQSPAAVRRGENGDRRSLFDALVADLHSDGFAGELARDGELGARTTYRCGGSAALVATATTSRDVELVLDSAQAMGLEVATVGRGSNLLVSDSGFDGVALVLDGEFHDLDFDTESMAVTAGSAVALPLLARRTAQAGMTGFEWAVGVPGSIGGAVRMNAGGHGSDLAASLVSAMVLRSGRGIGTEPAADLDLGYRTSNLADGDVVLRVSLQLHSAPEQQCRDRISEIVRWRRTHQPGGQNAGSVFANPPDDSAGRLIDAAGCKGLRIGTAVVSSKHANFIQVDAGGFADDVLALMAAVSKRVADKYGVTLRRETHLLGFSNQTRTDVRLTDQTAVDQPTVVHDKPQRVQNDARDNDARDSEGTS